MTRSEALLKGDSVATGRLITRIRQSSTFKNRRQIHQALCL